MNMSLKKIIEMYLSESCGFDTLVAWRLVATGGRAVEVICCLL
jgi:hypothetical protein